MEIYRGRDFVLQEDKQERRYQLYSKNVTKAISDTDKKLDIENSNSDKLHIKGTVWIAPIREYGSKNKFAKINEVYDNNTSFEGKNGTDFLGTLIDTGFRISKFSYKKVLIVDALLAYLICNENREEEGKMRIVSYEKLKGIWRNRHYPIIWYSDDNFDEDNIFDYDEVFVEDKNTSKIRRGFQEYFQKNSNLYEKLKKILNDVNEKTDIIGILQEIDRQNRQKTT